MLCSAGGRLSVHFFIPAFNEVEGLEFCVDAARAALAKLDVPYRLLLVDDGSSDGTTELVDRLAKHHPEIDALHHPTNRGYGAALRSGFAAAVEAGAEAVAYTDADHPVDMARFVEALPLLETADLVVGYRVRRQETLRRALYSRVYNLLVRILFGVRVRDVNFSFKWLRVDLLSRMELDSNTVFIDGQLLAEAHRCGGRIVEVPVEYQPRELGQSKFDQPIHAWRTGVDLLRWWWKQRRRPS